MILATVQVTINTDHICYNLPLWNIIHEETGTNVCFPNKESIINQSTDTTRVQLDEPISLLELLPGIWVMGYLEEQKLLKDS